MPIKNLRIFTISPWEKLDEFLKNSNYSSIHILCDEKTHVFCLPNIVNRFPDLQYHLTIIPCGEQHKNLSTAQSIWQLWLEQGIDRNALVICLGGGIVCDIGGFCASSILRGVDFVYIPTSLMAMADAAIGGKTGVNFNYYKNQIGTFSVPKAIVFDPDFLETLPERELRNGYVEIIKHSLIQSPPYYQNILELGWPVSKNDLVELIKKSIRTKTEIVEQDFTEKNLRKILNYGHTLGHAIESFNLMNGKDILHGEAIAAGMICESYLSATLFNWRAGTLESLGAFLKGFCENVVIDPADHEQIIKICEKDKKKHNQTPLFSLLKLPGNPAINQAVSQDIILKSLEYYN